MNALSWVNCSFSNSYHRKTSQPSWIYQLSLPRPRPPSGPTAPFLFILDRTTGKDRPPLLGPTTVPLSPDRSQEDPGPQKSDSRADWDRSIIKDKQGQIQGKANSVLGKKPKVDENLLKWAKMWFRIDWSNNYQIIVLHKSISSSLYVFPITSIEPLREAALVWSEEAVLGELTTPTLGLFVERQTFDVFFLQDGKEEIFFFFCKLTFPNPFSYKWCQH